MTSSFMTSKDKVDFIRKIVHPERAKGLELGPDVNPVFRKSEGYQVKYLDSVGTEALRERCIQRGTDPSQVETIDFILDRGKTLAEMVGGKALFDYVLSSHVIEHIPNPVAHFNEVGELLTERGCYVLRVPDRNLCFDCIKPLSTLGQILEPYVYGRQNASLASMIDEMRYGALPEGGGLGGWRYVPSQTVVPKYENRYRQITEIITRPEQRLAVWFGHQWRFSPGSFVSIMLDLNKLGLVGLHIEAIRPTGFMDFIVTLRKGGEPPPLNELVAQIGDYQTPKVSANDPELLLDQGASDDAGTARHGPGDQRISGALAGYHEIVVANREFKLARFHGSEYIERQLKSQTWEAPLPIILMGMVARTKGIFVDVGGSYGIYTILAGMTRADVEIHTFEPFREAVDLLHRNAVLNGITERVTIHNVALSDSAGQAKFYLRDPNHGFLETSNSLEAEFKKEYAGCLQVETKTLDSYSFDQPISVVKIDVEGHEHAVIKGARRMLVEDRPVIFAEMLSGAKKHFFEISQLIADHGYVSFRMRGACLIETPIITFDRLAWNYAFVPQEMMPTLQHTCATHSLEILTQYK